MRAAIVFLAAVILCPTSFASGSTQEDLVKHAHHSKSVALRLHGHRNGCSREKVTLRGLTYMVDGGAYWRRGDDVLFVHDKRHNQVWLFDKITNEDIYRVVCAPVEDSDGYQIFAKQITPREEKVLQRIRILRFRFTDEHGRLWAIMPGVVTMPYRTKGSREKVMPLQETAAFRAAQNSPAACAELITHAANLVGKAQQEMWEDYDWIYKKDKIKGAFFDDQVERVMLYDWKSATRDLDHDLFDKRAEIANKKFMELCPPVGKLLPTNASAA